MTRKVYICMSFADQDHSEQVHQPLLPQQVTVADEVSSHDRKCLYLYVIYKSRQFSAVSAAIAMSAGE